MNKAKAVSHSNFIALNNQQCLHTMNCYERYLTELKFLISKIILISGTVVDSGVFAPVLTFQKLFEDEGVPITSDEVRGPMGVHKRVSLLSLFFFFICLSMSVCWFSSFLSILTRNYGSLQKSQFVIFIFLLFLPIWVSLLKLYFFV
jgi:hypothetical protein